jgi:hypothetical protein
MTTEELIGLYFDKYPPVSELVRAMIQELAETIVEQNPNTLPENKLFALRASLTTARQMMYARLESSRQGKGTVSLNYQGQIFQLGPFAMSMLRSDHSAIGMGQDEGED